MTESKRISNEIMSLIDTEVKTIEGCFKLFDERAEAEFKLMFYTTPYQTLIADHTTAIMENKYTKCEVNEVKAAFDENPQSRKLNLKHYSTAALTNRVIAEQMYIEKNDYCAASALIWAAYFLGAAKSASDLTAHSMLDKYERNSHAARSKNSRYEKSRSYFANLIANDAPNGGWKTITHAASTLASKVREYEISSLKLMSDDDITPRLIRWSRKDSAIRTALTLHVLRKRSEVVGPRVTLEDGLGGS